MAAKKTNVVADEATGVADASFEAPEVIDRAFDQTFEQIEHNVAGVVASVETTQTEVRAKMDNAVKTAEHLMTFGQGNIEAFMKSGQIWTAGVQDLSKHVAAAAQAQFDETVATFKALTGVKSLKEAIDLQSTLARSNFEKAVAETGKITDASLKLAEQAMAPITARVTLAVETFGRTV